MANALYSNSAITDKNLVTIEIPHTDAGSTVPVGQCYGVLCDCYLGGVINSLRQL